MKAASEPFGAAAGGHVPRDIPAAKKKAAVVETLRDILRIGSR
jgi:hypothetical protein